MHDPGMGNVSYGLQMGHSELAVDRGIHGRERPYSVPLTTASPANGATGGLAKYVVVFDGFLGRGRQCR